MVEQVCLDRTRHVRQQFPYAFPAGKVDELKQVERERAKELQKTGVWRHLWRVAGRYSNLCIFDVSDAQELHEILCDLPLYPFMTIRVTSLCRHPSSIRDDDR
nr:muconolactone Delta-isomerase family protein [Bradyrhizobium sp. CCBAU 11386]